jgi:hypothetical protein
MAYRKKAMALVGCVAAFVAAGLGGCAGDRSAIIAKENNSHFEETGAGRYRFTAVMNSEYPANDQSAEAARQSWLRQDLALSNRCSHGANVTHRDVVVTGRDPQTGATVGEIVYVGDCA